MSDQRFEQLKLALSGEQTGGGLADIRVYVSPKQGGWGIGDMLSSFVRWIAPAALKVGKKLFKTSSAALKEGGSIGESFKSALKPTLGTALKHGNRALGKIIKQQEDPSAAPPIEPPLLHQDDRDVGTKNPLPQVGSGRYKANSKRKTKVPNSNSKRSNVHYNY